MAARQCYRARATDLTSRLRLTAAFPVVVTDTCTSRARVSVLSRCSAEVALGLIACSRSDSYVWTPSHAACPRRQPFFLARPGPGHLGHTAPGEAE